MMFRRRRATLVAAILILLRAGTAARAVEPAGSVTAVVGRPEALHATAAGWVAVAAGDGIFVGDQLRTGPADKLKLLFRDESVLTLAPASMLTVTEQAAGPSPPVSRFSMALGTLRAIVTERYGKPGARFEVETPTAVAGVHGTGFIATYDAAADESVVLGLFDVTRVRGRSDPGAAHEVRLGPGEMIRVPRRGLPTKAMRTPEALGRSLDAATTLVPELGGPAVPEKPGAPGGPSEPAARGPTGESTAPPESAVDQPIPLLDRPPRRSPQEKPPESPPPKPPPTPQPPTQPRPPGQLKTRVSPQG